MTLYFNIKNDSSELFIRLDQMTDISAVLDKFPDEDPNILFNLIQTIDIEMSVI